MYVKNQRRLQQNIKKILISLVLVNKIFNEIKTVLVHISGRKCIMSIVLQ